MSKVPASRPNLDQASVDKILAAKGIDRTKFPVCVLGVRGYYLDTMGVKGKNDRGIFDDAAFVSSPTAFVAVNFNTDPSAYRKGKGTGAGKGMASLNFGLSDYKVGLHKGKGPALVQAGKVTVIRDGTPDYEDTGYFGINHHWGSAVGTSSAGCQTVPPDQWPSYINPIVSELKRYGKTIVKYCLIGVKEMNEILNNPPTHKRDLSACAELIKKYEGLRLEAYKCPAGVWTIGWGTTKGVKPGMKITKEQAEQMFNADLLEYIAPVQRLVSVPVNDNEFGAMVSLCYNIGAGNFAKSSVLKKLNAGAPKAEVAEAFKLWNKGGGKVLAGLVKRRAEEAALFLRPVVMQKVA